MDLKRTSILDVRASFYFSIYSHNCRGGLQAASEMAKVLLGITIIVTQSIPAISACAVEECRRVAGKKCCAERNKQ